MDEFKLAFLVFRSRSGSTLFGDRLGRHPEVIVAPETNALPRLTEYFKNIPTDQNKINYNKIVDFFMLKKLQEWEISKQILIDLLCNYKPNSCWKVFYYLCKLYRDIVKMQKFLLLKKMDGILTTQNNY